MMSSIEPKQVELYLDYGTAPSLSYLFRFLKDRQNKQVIRFFGLSRFEFPAEIIQSYPEKTFYAYRIKEQDATAFFACFEQYLSEEKEQIALNFHLNCLHLWTTLPRLLYFCSQYQHKIISLHLHIYDDGSEGVVTQYNIAKVYPDYFKGDLSYPLSEIQKLVEGKPAHIGKLFLERYLWPKILPTTYYFLSDFFFKKAGLEKVVTDYQLLEMNQFHQLDKESQSMLLRILSISPELVDYWRKIFSQYKVFLFTGTTIYDLDSESEHIFSNLHINAVEHYLYANGQYYVGEDYVLAIKGHPNSHAINQRLKETYPNALHIPAHIPFEILIMLGCVPDKMGGFASTSYLDFPKERIVDVIFITYRNESKNINYTFQKQSELIEVMKEIGCISTDKIRYYSDVKKL